MTDGPKPYAPSAAPCAGAQGAVDYQGEHVAKAVARFSGPVDVPLMASALRPASFRVCGELADGAL